MHNYLLLITLFFQLLYAIPCASDVLEKLSTLRPITVHTFKQPYDADNPVFEQEVELSIDDILALDSPVLNSAIEWMPLGDQEPIPLYEVDAATLQVLLGDKEVEITAYKLANAKNFLQIPLKQQDYDSFSSEEWWQTCQNFRQRDIAPDGEVSYYYDAPGLDIAKNIFVWRKRREIFPAYAFFDTEKYVELLGVTDEFVIFRNQESLISFNYESSSVGCRESIDKDFKVCISGDNSTLLYIKNQTHHIDDVPDPLWLLSLKKNGEVHEKKLVGSFFNLPHFALSYDGKGYAYITDDYTGNTLCLRHERYYHSDKKIDPGVRDIIYAKNDNHFVFHRIKKSFLEISFMPEQSLKSYDTYTREQITDIVYTTVDNNLYTSIVRVEDNRFKLLIFDPTNPGNSEPRYLPERPVLAPQISSDGRNITIFTKTRTLHYKKDNETDTWQPDTAYCNHEFVTYAPIAPHLFAIQPISNYNQALISDNGLTLATKNDAGTITIWEKISLADHV